KAAELNKTAKAAAAELDKFEDTFFPRPKDKSADQSEKAAKLPDAIKTILKSAAGKRSGNQLKELQKQRNKDAPEYLSRLQKLRPIFDERDRFNRAMPRVMVMEDMPKPRQTFMLDKGLYDKRGDVVTAGVPERLPVLPTGAPVNRLGLARWLVAPENPLT